MMMYQHIQSIGYLATDKEHKELSVQSLARWPGEDGGVAGGSRDLQYPSSRWLVCTCRHFLRILPDRREAGGPGCSGSSFKREMSQQPAARIPFGAPFSHKETAMFLNY